MAYGLVACDGCDGCGYVTDGPHRIPWTWHTRELRDVNDKPLFGEAQRTECGKCHGSGRIERVKYNPFNWKKKRY